MKEWSTISGVSSIPLMNKWKGLTCCVSGHITKVQGFVNWVAWSRTADPGDGQKPLLLKNSWWFQWWKLFDNWSLQHDLVWQVDFVLDNAIIIWKSLMHWFDHSTPAATQCCDVIEWSTRAMVIEPNTGLYNEMIWLYSTIKKVETRQEQRYME
jgi:hypothetical protein